MQNSLKNLILEKGAIAVEASFNQAVTTTIQRHTTHIINRSSNALTPEATKMGGQTGTRPSKTGSRL